MGFSEQEDEVVRVFVLPYTDPGHMAPIMNIATLLASRGIKITIITTSINLPFFSEAISVDNRQLQVKIDLLTLEFPSGIPEGHGMFFNSVKLQNPFEKLVQEFKPHCLIADTFYYWAFNSAANKFGIPCLAFDGCGYFSQCVISCILKHKPHNRVSSDSETFVVPGDLPHEIKFTRLQLPYYDLHSEDNTNPLTELINQRREALRSSYGVIVNSFYDLESAYVDYFGGILGRKNWHIGPVSLHLACKKEQKSSIDLDDCVRNWLDGKEVNSVIYICFGSISNIQEDQLHELLMALESSTQNFVLVLREGSSTLDDGFEELVKKEQGLIIKGWAPQKLILEHRAIGGFMTHCGWNSILEGVINGLPMLTWPHHAEQFYNEKLVTDVLKIGVQIGSEKWVARFGGEGIMVGKEKIMNGIRRLMTGSEAEDMKVRVRELKQLARKAVSEGGSSDSDLNALIQELKCLRCKH